MGERLGRRTSGFTFLPADLSRRHLQILAGAAVVLLALDLWGMGADRNYRATGTTLPGQTYLDPDQPVYLERIP
jgi:hypothetical protein